MNKKNVDKLYLS